MVRCDACRGPVEMARVEAFADAGVDWAICAKCAATSKARAEKEEDR